MNQRNVLITGAAGGIGQALVRRFIAGGDHVFAQDRDLDGLAALVAAHGDAITPVAAELTDEGALAAALKQPIAHRGAVTVLIANAGSAEGLTLRGSDAAMWRRDVDNNLHAGYLSVNAVLDGMRAARGGAIVFIGSVNGLAALGHPAYSAAKAGLISYSKSIAIEFGRDGVRSNVICPGTVKTPAWQARADKDPLVFEKLKKWYPLGDFATPEDIADASWFLASPQSRMITGAMLAVDGGLTAGNPVMASELTLEQF
jgi:NAD(P)-dependent dehydrogenase (short-subunit alcohol dehydrogenase family)